jgi:hypothetical protein
MFDPLLALIFSFFAIVVVAVIVIVVLMNTFEEEERISTVKRKWTEKDVVMVWFGVAFMGTPVTNHYFEMDNGDVVKVSSEEYERHVVGSSYTYMQQVKRQKK